MKRKCENCQAWHKNAGQGNVDNPAGQCRMEPPKGHLVQNRANEGGWPPAFADGWCMQFMPHEVKKEDEDEQSC